MIPKKFRAYDTELGKYRTFYLSELLLDAPNFEFVDQYEVVQLVGHDKKGEEIYEGDVIDFTENGEPLSAELTPCLRDKFRREYFPGGLIR